MLQKPREKLALLNPKELNDDELLSIILSRGSKKENVFDLSKRILKNFDKDELLNLKNVHQFQKNFQIGFVQACQLIATFELGKRFFNQNPAATEIRTISQAYELLKNMQYLKKEHLRGLYVNTHYRLIHNEIISIGGLESNIIHSRDIFRPAIEYNAYAIILAHNHPSGDPSPSEEDIKTTEKLIEVGKLLQIPILDHLIIGKDCYTSLCTYKKSPTSSFCYP